MMEPPTYALQWWARWGLVIVWHRFACRYCRAYARARPRNL